MSRFQLLIVEDDASSVDQLAAIGDNVGFAVTICANRDEALVHMSGNNFDVIMCDLHTGGKGELSLLKFAKEKDRNTAVIIITDSDSVERAVEALKLGALQYITKPYRFPEVENLLRNARDYCILHLELKELREMISSNSKLTIIGKSPKIQEIKEFIEKVANLDCTILLEGETGTGKEFFARLIHENSRRAENKFFAANCGAFIEELLSNELFGHEKEAFTGAQQRHLGLFEAANGGTLLLDEIGEMPLSSQVKLLRVLQEGAVTRVGGSNEVPVDVRVIAATNRNLQQEVDAGRFRRDLYYRLNVISLRIPALRERLDDIPLFCKYFMTKFSAKYDKRIERIDESAMEALLSYKYPGNVRELINIIERAVILAEDNVIQRQHLPQRMRETSRRAQSPVADELCTLCELEKRHIVNVLRHAGGNKVEAARILGIDRATLWRKCKRYQLTCEEVANRN